MNRLRWIVSQNVHLLAGCNLKELDDVNSMRFLSSCSMHKAGVYRRHHYTSAVAKTRGSTIKLTVGIHNVKL